MALNLFSRSPADPAEPGPAPEDWTPEGTIVVQRYRGLEGAVVLVYTSDNEPGSTCYAAACLGCTRRTAENDRHDWLSEEEAAVLANDHAATCRAMPRGVPARPDDIEAAGMIRSRLWGMRTCGGSLHSVHLADFHADRVDLQRPTRWITETLADLAKLEPDFVTATPTSGGGTRFTVRPFLART